MYIYTLLVMRRMGSEPKGSKINRKRLEGKELEMPLGGNGGEIGRQYPSRNGGWG